MVGQWVRRLGRKRVRKKLAEEKLMDESTLNSGTLNVSKIEIHGHMNSGEVQWLKERIGSSVEVRFGSIVILLIGGVVSGVSLVYFCLLCDEGQAIYFINAG